MRASGAAAAGARLARPRTKDAAWGSAVGLSLLEVLLALAAGTTATALAVPIFGGALDELRTATAARYVASRLRAARMDAVRGSRAVGLRFTPSPDQRDESDYVVDVIGDGNGNGIRTAEIGTGTDTVLIPGERLRERFPGIAFGLLPEVPDADGREGTGQDGVRIGTAQILTMSSDGTATAGTLYIRGRRGQYAVRVLGTTGRTRMLQYEAGTRTWIDR
jgi:type II secretory pathway pseudopilin PulG